MAINNASKMMTATYHGEPAKNCRYRWEQDRSMKLQMS